MGHDYYNPKTMRGVIRRTLPLRTFFRTRFFSFGSITFPTKDVSFEFQEGKRRLAPYVSERIGSEELERDGYNVRTFGTPLVGPKRTITNDTLAQKLLGESEWNSGMTPEERGIKIAAQDIMALQDAIYRREEYMCARAKQDGVLTIKGRGVHFKVDYEFDNIIKIGSSDRWTPTFDILGQLDTLSEEQRKYGVNPDMLILGSKATKALLNNERLLKLLDIKRVEMGEIKPNQLEPGVRYIGRIISAEITLDMYCYDEWYPDKDDLDNEGNPKLKPLVDPETVIMQSSAEQNSMLYGAITLMDRVSRTHVTHMDPYVPHEWITEEPPQRFISIKSRPLPMPHDLKSWLVLKGVVSGGI